MKTAAVTTAIVLRGTWMLLHLAALSLLLVLLLLLLLLLLCCHNVLSHLQVTTNSATSTSYEWDIINLSGDSHPIHLHHVDFEVQGLNLHQFRSLLTLKNLLSHTSYTSVQMWAVGYGGLLHMCTNNQNVVLPDSHRLVDCCIAGTGHADSCTAIASCWLWDLALTEITDRTHAYATNISLQPTHHSTCTTHE